MRRGNRDPGTAALRSEEVDGKTRQMSSHAIVETSDVKTLLPFPSSTQRRPSPRPSSSVVVVLAVLAVLAVLVVLVVPIVPIRPNRPSRRGCSHFACALVIWSLVCNL